MREKKQSYLPAILVLLCMVLLIIIYVLGACLSVRPKEDEITQGVFIEDVDISGMTANEAKDALDSYIDKISSRTLRVNVNGENVTTTLKNLGYTYEEGDAISKAMEIGHSGNIFKDYSQIKKAKNENVKFELTYTYSEKKLKKFVKNECEKKCKRAKNAKIQRKNGKFVYKKEKDGVEVDINSTIENIKKELVKQSENEIVDVVAVIEVQKPTITLEQVSKCKDKIGTFTTQFNAYNVSRSKNVANAARLINGKTVYPGETFSVHDTISPLTEKNGYYAAPSYSNGEVVDSIGGGVCQVSTTLYNAVLRAELEIVERSPHSMVVSYVKPSMDAAIAGDYKDFKFRNNTEVPIYIEGGVYSGNVYFNVYGEETRDPNRIIEFESETLETINPGADKIIYDNKKPEGYTSITQEAHIGYKAVLWKKVTENGKTKKTQVNSSTYKPSPRYITKGTLGANSNKATESQKPAATATPKPTKEAVNSSKQQETSSPKSQEKTVTKATPAPTAVPTKAPKMGE